MSRSGDKQQCDACMAGESVACWRKSPSAVRDKRARLVNQGLDFTLCVNRKAAWSRGLAGEGHGVMHIQPKLLLIQWGEGIVGPRAETGKPVRSSLQIELGEGQR